jgi:DNA-binding XRE family transcriptional regulator
MSLRAIAKAVGVSKSTVGNVVNEATVQDWTPDSSPPIELDPEPDPLPAAVSRSERAHELAEAGLTQDAIAAELGVSQATVWSARPLTSLGA